MLASVLICDDSTITRQLLANICRRLDIVAHVACDGREAVEMCRANIYRLVVLDEVMPYLRETEAAALIRTLPAPFGTPGIVLLTARPLAAFSVMELFEAGVDDVIEKPFGLEEIEYLFLHGLGRSRLFSYC